MKCPKCGIYTRERYCPECGGKTIAKRKRPKQSKAVTAVKLVIGILSIVLFAFVMLQSCALTSIGAIEEDGNTTGGLLGVLLAALLLVAGITGIVTRREAAGGLITASLWIVAAIIGYIAPRHHGDLSLWALVALVFGTAYFVMTFLSFYKRRFYKKWWFYVICALIVIAIVAAVTNDSKVGEPEENNTSGDADTQMSDTMPISGTPQEDAAEQQVPGVLEVENFKVTYISHSLVTDSWDNANCLDIVFEFENYGDEPANYEGVTYCQAYQDGVQLETTSYTNEECEDWGTQVMAGAPILVNDTFVLRNTDSPVQVIMTEFLGFSDEKMEITLELK